MTQVVQYIEIDVPHCSLTYSVPPCTASLASPATGTRKCFNSLGTCQDRIHFTDAPITLRFSEDVSFAVNLYESGAPIDAYPFIKSIEYQPAIVDLGGSTGQRASVKVVFRDAPHSDAGPNFDKYASTRPYSDPFARGTFWGKFRARNPFMRGRALRLYIGRPGDVLADMETRHFIIDSIAGPNADGEFSITAKDVLKLAAADRALAPAPSGGFLAADITTSDIFMTLNPVGIGASSYPASGYAVLGGNEIVSFTHDLTAGIDAFALSVLHFNTAGLTVDSGTAPKTWTLSQAAQSTTTKVFGIGSMQQDGASDFVNAADHADWDPGSGNFTIEMWFNCTAAGGTERCLFGSGASDAPANASYQIFRSTGNVMVFRAAAGGVFSTVTGTVQYTNSTNPGFHSLLAQRNGGNLQLFIDGIQQGGNVAISGALTNSTGFVFIGAMSQTNANYWLGFTDEFRWSKGIARASGNYTPAVNQFEASADVFTLTARAQLNTVAASHAIDDTAQVLLRYVTTDPAVIIADLLQNYADVPASYIPLADWQTETASYLGIVFTWNVCEPTGVDDLLKELLEQMGGAIWWDDVNRTIRLQILRAIATTADRYNEDNVLADTLEVIEQPEKRISQVLVYFGQLNPTLKLDEVRNYRSLQTVTDAQSEADQGSAAVKKIYARSIAQGGRAVATRIAQKWLSRYVQPPRRFNFSLQRYASTPVLGSGYLLGGGTPRLGSWPFQDDTGARRELPVQLTRLKASPDIFEAEAEEVLFTAFGADINPNVRNIVFDSDDWNVNLRAYHDRLYAAPTAGNIVNAYINNGVKIGTQIELDESTGTTNPLNTASAAFDVGTWPVGVTVHVYVYGRIQGHGGNGGGSWNQAPFYFPPPTVGLPALYTRRAITVHVETGEIWSGGGGGGGGNGSGGGGGAGFNSGFGGVGNFTYGATGTTEAGGAGPGFGGAGGGPGLSGGNGSGTAAQTGAAAGAAVDGISFVTYSATPPGGAIRGGTIN